MAAGQSARRIVILGGGFTGAVLATKIIDAAQGPLDVRIVEPSPQLGGGVAYGTQQPWHLVNGPATVFSIHTDREDHFARWLDGHIQSVNAPASEWREGEDTFAPRQVYGAYIRSELERAAASGVKRNIAFTHVRASAIDVRPERDGATVVLEGRQRIEADHVLLAPGVPPSRAPFVTDALLADSRYLHDPWKHAEYARLASAKRILLVGSGLTMLDAVVSLDQAGFSGEALVVSRRGLSVWPRRPAEPCPNVLDPTNLPRTARGVLRAVQRARKAIAASGGDWQGIALSIGPHIQTLWDLANERERAIFLRHLRVFWEITRHKAPPPTAKVAARWREQGRLTSAAGNIIGIGTESSEGLTVHLRWRGEKEPAKLAFDAVINCTGNEYNVKRAALTRPLLRNLLDGGVIRPGPLSFGIDADKTGAVIGRDGTANHHIRAVGPLVRGVFWESNAIPEILVQINPLAKQLAAEPAEASAV
jgi:uncharacterized NAD(P)/FAD-binding protein YdhS